MRKNYFKKLAMLASFVLICSNFIQAQVNNPIAAIPDTTGFKPMGKVWGYVFGDYAYVNHADQYASSRANSNVTYENSTGATWPQNYSAFDFRRIYLGYDYSFAPKFSSQLTLANEEGKPNIDQSSNRDFYIKYASIRWKGLYHNAD